MIPAYNEENRIRGVLERYRDFYSSYEIIVVCNGCADSTPEIAEELAREDKRVRVLVFKEKLGKGGAITEGFKSAKGELIGFLDADESVDPENYLKIVTAIRGDVDGAIGSRRATGAKILISQPLMRRTASRVFNVLVRGLFGLNFKDTQCGAKAFRKDAIADVINGVSSIGYEFDVELLWRLQKGGKRIVEVPIVWSHGEGSKFNLKSAPTMLVSMLRIRLME